MRPLLLFSSPSASSLFTLSSASLTPSEANERHTGMLLGKRPRFPIKRTASMSEIIFDLNHGVEEPPSSDHRNTFGLQQMPAGPLDASDQRFLAAVSTPRPHRRYSDNFLKSCGLCRRRLVPGRDIYMYRGDTAFCSQECRQKQMNQDERKEKCSLASKKQAAATTSTGKGETVSAV